MIQTLNKPKGMLVLFRHTTSSNLRRQVLLMYLVSGCDGNPSAGTQTASDSLAFASTTTSGTSQGATGGGVSIVRPRWILRDKNGTVIEALVQPSCGDPQTCDLSDFWEDPTYPCVNVVMLGEKFISLMYRLSDGSPLGCHKAGFDPAQGACSLTADCLPPYFAGYQYVFGALRPDVVRSVYQDGGQLFYVSPNGSVEGECWAPGFNGCTLVAGKQTLFPILPVPEEVMNALPDAPYKLEVAYD